LCTLADLSNGATTQVTVTGTAPAGGTVTSTATVSSTTPDPTPPNNTSTTTTAVTVTVASAADLSLVKTLSSALISGGHASYLITVTNLGGAAAVAPLTVTDNLPSGLTYESASGDGWTCSAAGQLVTCTRPSALDPGAATLTVKVGVTLGPGSAIANTAEVAAVAGEMITGNNASTATAVVVKAAVASVGATAIPAANRQAAVSPADSAPGSPPAIIRRRQLPVTGLRASKLLALASLLIVGGWMICLAGGDPCSRLPSRES